MHVMFGLDGHGPDAIQLSAVAFELTGDVREPHELLQFEERWLDLRIALDPAVELGPRFRRPTSAPPTRSPRAAPSSARATPGLVQFFDFCERWMGIRGGAWPRYAPDLGAATDLLELFVGRASWKAEQVFDFRTLLMLAQKVPRALFRSPDMRNAGLDTDQVLHACVTQAVVAQSAFRALTEHTATRENAALIARLSE